MVNAKHTSASTLRVVAALGAALVGIASACSDSTTSGPGDAASTVGQGGATGGAAGVSSGSGGTSNGGATPEGGTSNGGANREGGTPSGGTTNTGGGNGSGGADGATPGGSIGNDGSGKADASNARDAAQEATVVRDAATDALVTPARGGSSARTVCPMGMTFGNPLTGMGPVTQLSPPSTPPANSFVFLEGPVWIASLGTLFFSDNASTPAERIFKLVPPATTAQLFLD
ncbi:MAG TPA: hypothetical protein VGL13_00645, partial [Polyangiaceae bacterium]